MQEVWDCQSLRWQAKAEKQTKPNLGKSSPKQKSLLMEIPNRLQRNATPVVDNFDGIPDELLTRILRSLSAKDRIRLECICHRWLLILREEVWKDTSRITVSARSVSLNSCCTRSITKMSSEIITDATISLIRRCVGRLESLSFQNLLMDQVNSFFNLNAPELLSLIEASSTFTQFELSDIAFDIKNSEQSRVAESIRRYCTHKSLKALVFDSNTSLNSMDEPFWTHGGSPFVSQFLGSKLFPSLSGLCALHIEDVTLHSRALYRLCENLAPTLERFCFKLPDCKLNKRSLCSCLSMLKNLRELNIGGRRPHTKSITALIDDSVVPELFSELTLLEKLNIRSAVPLSNRGLSLLLKLCPKLSLLNLIRCCNVTTQGFYELLHSEDQRDLLVFVYGTGISSDSELVGKNSRVKCVSDLSRIDESVFWGERKLEELADLRSSRDNEFDVSLIASYDESFLLGDDYNSSDSSDEG